MNSSSRATAPWQTKARSDQDFLTTVKTDAWKTAIGDAWNYHSGQFPTAPAFTRTISDYIWPPPHEHAKVPDTLIEHLQNGTAAHYAWSPLRGWTLDAGH